VDAASAEEKLIKAKFGKLDDQESLKKLDAFLEDKSYLCATQSCTKLDAEAYRMTQSVNLEGLNNVIRWRKHIASFENEFAILKSGSL
jgi:nucleoside-diphosphate-sugar epimerase